MEGRGEWKKYNSTSQLPVVDPEVAWVRCSKLSSLSSITSLEAPAAALVVHHTASNPTTTSTTTSHVCLIFFVLVVQEIIKINKTMIIYYNYFDL
jgi:hypothetical protein